MCVIPLKNAHPHLFLTNYTYRNNGTSGLLLLIPTAVVSHISFLVFAIVTNSRNNWNFVASSTRKLLLPRSKKNCLMVESEVIHLLRASLQKMKSTNTIHDIILNIYNYIDNLYIRPNYMDSLSNERTGRYVSTSFVDCSSNTVRIYIRWVSRLLIAREGSIPSRQTQLSQPHID